MGVDDRGNRLPIEAGTLDGQSRIEPRCRRRAFHVARNGEAVRTVSGDVPVPIDGAEEQPTGDLRSLKTRP